MTGPVQTIISTIPSSPLPSSSILPTHTKVTIGVAISVLTLALLLTISILYHRRHSTQKSADVHATTSQDGESQRKVATLSLKKKPSWKPKKIGNTNWRRLGSGSINQQPREETYELSADEGQSGIERTSPWSIFKDGRYHSDLMARAMNLLGLLMSLICCTSELLPCRRST